MVTAGIVGVVGVGEGTYTLWGNRVTVSTIDDVTSTCDPEMELLTSEPIVISVTIPLVWVFVINGGVVVVVVLERTFVVVAE